MQKLRRLEESKSGNTCRIVLTDPTGKKSPDRENIFRRLKKSAAPVRIFQSLRKMTRRTKSGLPRTYRRNILRGS